MKAKIIGILVCLMLMTAFLTTAQDVENIPKKYKPEEPETILFGQVDAPVWEVGDKWTFKMDRFTVDFEDSDLIFYMDVKIDELLVEVTKVTVDNYELTFEAGVTGTFWIDFDFGDGPINISFELKSATIEGTILLNKTDLGIKQIHPKIYGTIDLKIEEQPYIKFPFKLNKEIVGTIALDLIMESLLRPIIKFPFSIGECWGLSETIFTLNGTIESPLFDSIDNINRKVVNPLLMAINNSTDWPIIERLLELSNILLDVLPIINISKILNDYLGMEIEFIIPPVPPIICCFGTDIITVPAGTFECYNISILGTNVANLYYNETTGMIIKASGNFQDILPSVTNINAELVSYEI